MQEDIVTNELIQYHSKYDRLDTWFSAESHYEYHGNRGAVDLWAAEYDPRTDSETHYVYEVKSNAALRHITGANEILRQVNRMRDNFYRDSRNPVPTGPEASIYFMLVFAPTSACVRHVQEFRDIYEHVPSRFDLGGIPVSLEVRFHTPPEALRLGSVNRQQPGESLQDRFGGKIASDSRLGQAFSDAGVPVSG